MWEFFASFRLCPRRSLFVGRKNTTPNGRTSSQNDDDHCEWEVIPIPSTSTAAGLGMGAAKQDAEDTRPSDVQTSPDKAKVADSKSDHDRLPCLGEHVPVRRANQHASWTTCARCSLRLSYEPAQRQTSQGPMAEVAEAISQLHVQCQAINATAELLSTNISHIKNDRGVSRKKKKAWSKWKVYSLDCIKLFSHTKDSVFCKSIDRYVEIWYRYKQKYPAFLIW